MIHHPLFVFLCVSLLCISCQNTTITESTKVEKAAIANHSKIAKRNIVYQSIDEGKTWQAADTGLPIGTQVSNLRKLGNQIILSTDNEGLFISNKEKTEWSSIGHQLPDRKINALNIAGTEIYAGVYQKGLFFSSDQGKNWVTLNYNLPDLRVGAIAQTELGLLAGTDSGLFLLKKGTTVWTLVSEPLQITSFSGQGETLVAGTSKGILLSKDSGENWHWVQTLGAIHTISLVEETLIAMYLSGDLTISKDLGKTWTTANYGPKMAAYGYAAATQTGKNFILSNNYGIHRSKDGGYNWELFHKEEDLIFYDFLVDGKVIYAGTRGWKEKRKKSNLPDLFD